MDIGKAVQLSVPFPPNTIFAPIVVVIYPHTILMGAIARRNAVSNHMVVIFRMLVDEKRVL